MEAYQRERKEEAERIRHRQEEARVARADAAVVAPPDPQPVNQPIMQRLLDIVRGGREQPVAREQPDNAHEQPVVRANGWAAAAEAANVDPGVARTRFWQIIAQLNWHNLSDGRIGVDVVTKLVRGLSAIDRAIFAREYTSIYTGAVQVLEADGMFDRNGAGSHSKRAEIVSHVIALGEDQYTTLISDLGILQFLVETGECQSLNSLLPDDIRV
jgi:hypothetical protein